MYDNSMDRLQLRSKIENVLLGKGFEVISKDVAIEKSKRVKNASEDRTSSKEESYKSIDVKSVYLLKFTYTYQQAPKTVWQQKTKYVLEELNGSITDLADGGKLVASYSYKRGTKTDKEPEDVIEELISRLLN